MAPGDIYCNKLPRKLKQREPMKIKSDKNCFKSLPSPLIIIRGTDTNEIKSLRPSDAYMRR